MDAKRLWHPYVVTQNQPQKGCHMPNRRIPTRKAEEVLRLGAQGKGALAARAGGGVSVGIAPDRSTG